MRNRTSTILTLAPLALMLSFACGEPEPTKTDTRDTDAKADGGDGKTDGTDGNGGDEGGGDAGAGKDPAAAAGMWVNQVKPALEATCSSCHAEPRFVVPNRGPLTIFSYDSVKAMMADGTSSTDNKFIRKPLGEDNHGGGVRCNADADPCKLIIELRKLEFGADAGGGGDDGEGPLPADADPRNAAITSVTSAGRVVGWAVDKADLKKKVAVKLVLDAQLPAGVVAGTTTADKLVDDGKHPGDHGFFIQIADQFRTGADRDVYIYDGDTLLTPTPSKFKAWAPSTTARTYFDSTLGPALRTGCGVNNCHAAPSVSDNALYTWAFNAIIVEGPNEGGTKTSNVAVKKPTGAVSHGGGQRCASLSAAPCTQFQAWWDVIFGP